MTVGRDLLHVREKHYFAAADYRAIDKRFEAKDMMVQWHVAMTPSVRPRRNRTLCIGLLIDRGGDAFG